MTIASGVVVPRCLRCAVACGCVWLESRFRGSKQPDIKGSLNMRFQGFFRRCDQCNGVRWMRIRLPAGWLDHVPPPECRQQDDGSICSYCFAGRAVFFLLGSPVYEYSAHHLKTEPVGAYLDT